MLIVDIELSANALYASTACNVVRSSNKRLAYNEYCSVKRKGERERGRERMLSAYALPLAASYI